MRKAIRSKTLSEKKRRKNIVFTSIFGGFVLSLFLFLIWVSYNENFLINEIEVVASLKADKVEIEEVVRNSLSGYSFFFFPHRNFILVPVKEMEQKVSSLDPIIKEVDIQRVGSKKLVVKIVEREPSVLWCGEGSTCFYADDSGVIFLPAPRFSGDTYPTYVSEISGDPRGKNFAEASELESLESFRRFLEEVDLGVDRIVLRGGGNYEALVDTGARIIFNLENIDEKATNIKTLLESEESAGEGFTFNDLDYVDLRYGNKIFWKPVDSQ